MSAAIQWTLVSVEDYLAGELVSPIKHEYLAGTLHAMAGARIAHNNISSNIVVATGSRLRGKRCRVYTSDMKVRIQLSDHIRFYYPDVSIVCESNPPTIAYQDKPAAIFEVLSQDTRRADIGEKKDAYLTIPSLHAYVLVEQHAPLVVVFRRTSKGFEREVHEGLDAVVPLREVGIELPLAEIYEAVTFTPETCANEEG